MSSARDPSRTTTLDSQFNSHTYRDYLLRSIKNNGISIDTVPYREPYVIVLPAMRNQDRNRAAIFRAEVHKTKGYRASMSSQASTHYQRSLSVCDDSDNYYYQLQRSRSKGSDTSNLSMYQAVLKAVENNTVIKQLRKQRKAGHAKTFDTKTELPQFQSTPVSMSKASEASAPFALYDCRK